MSMKKFLLSFAMLVSLACMGNTHLKISFITPDIVRVQWDPFSRFVSNGTGICIYNPEHVDVSVTEDSLVTSYQSSNLKVDVSKVNDAVSFRDAKTNRLIFQECPHMPHQYETIINERVVYDDSSARIEETANGKITVKDVIRRDTAGVNNKFILAFKSKMDEGLFGLGCHMEDYMNLQGKTLYLTQHNLKVSVPFLNSSNGYGLLFDAGCAMKFSSQPDSLSNVCNNTLELDAARHLDYYFINGSNMTDAVAGYRYLTGQVSMMPRYLFGYIQSKERYISSDDILQTLAEYRRRHIPIDMMVQDWNYWPEGWGYMKMDSRYYPSPSALADSVHKLNARLMVSIWPNPQGCPQESDFKSKGFMLEHSVYNAFDSLARKHYWEYAKREFFDAGFDAWWCDSSEPLDGDWNKTPQSFDDKPYGWHSHEQRWHLNKQILSETLGAERSCLFSLYHAMGIYENQRETSDSKRVVNLTRSGYAGQQRYGTIVWNGDTHASWESFRQQIPAGLNYMATGNPYWTVDVGSFFVKSDPRWFYKGQFPNGVADESYREYYTRMFQWASFLPVLRSHGTDTPREIWQFGEPGTKYYDAILEMIELRYSLIPYIYSLAASQSSGGYSMCRMMPFDFPEDHTTFDIKDQYMFGDFLVCPVVEPDKNSRMVYLPKSDSHNKWIDYWTGNSFSPGQWIEADAPINKIPLFIPDGSIIARGEPVEYADAQIGKPVEIKIFSGKDAVFDFYEDGGDDYSFEKGNFSLIRFEWNDSERILHISDRNGTFLQGTSEFIISTEDSSTSVRYNGTSQSIRL